MDFQIILQQSLIQGLQTFILAWQQESIQHSWQDMKERVGGLLHNNSIVQKTVNQYTNSTFHHTINSTFHKIMEHIHETTFVPNLMEEFWEYARTNKNPWKNHTLSSLSSSFGSSWNHGWKPIEQWWKDTTFTISTKSPTTSTFQQLLLQACESVTHASSFCLPNFHNKKTTNPRVRNKIVIPPWISKRFYSKQGQKLSSTLFLPSLWEPLWIHEFWWNRTTSLASPIELDSTATTTQLLQDVYEPISLFPNILESFDPLLDALAFWEDR